MQAAAVEQTNSAAAGQAQDPQDSITVPLVLQVSEALTPLLDTATDTGKQFYEQLVQVRNGLYYDLGVIFPAIQVKGNTPGEAGSYTIWANEVPVVSGQIRLDAALVNDTAENLAIYGFKAEDTSNPATGKAAAWVPRADAERAKAVGLQVWDTHEILLLHGKVSGYGWPHRIAALVHLPWIVKRPLVKLTVAPWPA